MSLFDKMKGPKEKTGGVVGKEMYRFFHNKAPNKPALVLLAIVLVGAAIGVYLFMNNVGNTENIEVNLGESKLFSQEDLEKSKEAVVTFFSRKVNDSELLAINYDEDFSQKKAVEYCDMLQEENQRDPKDIIVMQIDFDTGDQPPNAYEANKEYRNYTVLTVRGGAMGVWRVVGSGL